METRRVCSECKKPLAANAPQGLCPECLIKAGLGTGVDIGPDTQAGSGQTPFVAPMPEEVGRLFPQLEILGFIGQGGMGAVYKARQKQLDRVVALKILPPGIGSDAAFAERFTREAKSLARLNHPGIVTLFEFGQADGLFFFLMEFVDGVSLRHLLEVRRISSREALAIVPQICDALQYAHDQGIVHRDIKPENILLDRQGRVKVADFGLAKLVGTEVLSPALPQATGEGGAAAPGEGTQPPAGLTGAGRVMGTPQYMAPEQREHPTEVDHRADIYSLGVVFYQMLTGELPGRPIEPPSRRVEVDMRIDEIVMRALEKTPELRYQTVADFRTQIKSVVNDTGTTRPANRPDSSAPRLLKGGTSFVTAPEQLGSFEGQFFLYRRRSQLLLDDRQLTVSRAGSFTVIPLAAIRDLSIGRYPRTMHPLGLDFISLTYDEDGQPKRLFFSPYESWFGLPSNFNRIVAEWFAAIRAAVTAATGREPGNTPAEQLGVPSASKAIYALLLLPLILGGASVFALLRWSTGDDATPSFRVGLVVSIFALLAFAFLAPFVFGRFFGGSRKPAAPPRFSRTAVVALLLSLGGCLLSLLIGLVLFQSWGWVYGSFFAIETVALILGIVAWDKRTGKAAVILSFALMLAWSPGVITRMAQVAPNNLPKKSPREAAATANRIGQLSQGIVDLVAVSYHPSTNQPWWRPDGSPCREGPFGLRGSHTSGAADRMTREFVIRATGLPADASWPVWKLDPSGGWTGGEVCVGGQPEPDLRGISASLPKSARTVAVKVGVGMGAWQTVAKQVPGGSSMTGFSHEGSNWVVSFPKAESTEGGARVLVVHTVKDRDMRVLAVDKDDQEHAASGSESSGTEAFSHITAKFPGLPLEQVKEFLFQVRSYQWVEFRNVALYPKQPLDLVEPSTGLPPSSSIHPGSSSVDALDKAPQPTSGGAFLPAVELVVPHLPPGAGNSVLLDLDTGQWSTNANFQVGPDPPSSQRQWLRRTGADLAATPDPKFSIVIGCDMVLSPTDTKAWETCTAATVMNDRSLMTNEPSQKAFADKAEGEPDTFLFRTREGGRGILQVLGHSTNPPGVKIRYRLVQAVSKPSSGILQLRLVASDTDSNAPSDVFPDPEDQTGRRTVRVLKEILLDGSAITRAGWDRSGLDNRRRIMVELTEAGVQELDHITAHNVNRQLAIIFRGTLLAAPTIRSSSPYPQGRFVIDGLFTEADICEIIDALNRAPTSSASRVFSSTSTAVLPYLTKEGTNCVLLDLDAGRWATNAVYRPGVSEWSDWMRGEGMDMLALGKSVPLIIMCFDLGLAPVENPEWDTIAAADVLNYWPLMTTVARHHEQLRQDPYATNTYLLRTREGGRGLLQILGNSTNPPGVRIRYRLVQVAGSAAPAARLKLEQAQAEFARIQELYDRKLASQSQYEAARLARDLAEAELSGDTAAVLRVQLQEARQQFLQATERHQAGLASEDEVEKAKLARDLAEARLSGEAAAIARAELQPAQQEFLRVEGLFKARLTSQAEFEKAKFARDAAQAQFAISGPRSNGDIYSSVTGHAYFCQGKPRSGLEGWEQGWKIQDGCLMNTGETARVSTTARFGKEDLIVSAGLSLDDLNGSGAAFTFGDGYAFEFDPPGQQFMVSGPTHLRTYQRTSGADLITARKRLLFTAVRRGPLLDFLIDDKLILSVQFDGEMGTLGFAPRKGAMRIHSFGVSQMWPGPSASPPQTNASRTFPLRHRLASDMADDLRQILLGRSGQEAKPAADNVQLTVTAPPEVLKRVTTFVAVADWPDRIAPGPDLYYPRENVEHAARSLFYACSIEDIEGVASMLSPPLLAELKGTDLTAHGVLGEENDAEVVRQLRGNWAGKETAVQKVVQAWNRFPLRQLRASSGVAIGFGLRYFASAAFEGAPEDFTELSFIPDRAGGTNGPLLIDTLPPWFAKSGLTGPWQGGFRAKEEWEDAGASTPEAALQTLLWAGREKALDRLDETVFLPPDRYDDWYQSYTNDVPHIIASIKRCSGVSLDAARYDTPAVAVIEMTLDGIPTNQVAVSKVIRMIRVAAEWKCDYPHDSLVAFKTREHRPASSK